MKTFKQLIKEASGYMATQGKIDKELAGAEIEDLLKKNRTKINNALLKAGLDGNGRFRTITAMQSVVGEILTPLGFWVDFSDLMPKNTGHQNFPIFYSDKQNIKIKNRMLAFQWELRNPDDDQPKQWAAVVYVS